MKSTYLVTIAVLGCFTLLYFSLASHPKSIVSPIVSITIPTPTPALIPSPIPTPIPTPVSAPRFDVPFTSQAPFANWKDPRQQDGCEEAAVLMAMKWVNNEQIASKQAALDEILALSKFQEDKYGSYHDTDADDTVKRLFNDYYHYFNVSVKNVTSAQDIITELSLGHLVITPMNGQALNNPHFTPPGPERHNIVVKGFANGQFITNDPGIKEGENYRYPEDVFFAAIRDYPTGDHASITAVVKRMIIISKI